MFSKVLVANRSAVAAWILKGLNETGRLSVAVYSEADAGAPYLALATEAYEIGEATAEVLSANRCQTSTGVAVRS